MAHTVSSILGEHFFVVPAWGHWMERGVLLAHRHVFAVLFWFVLLPGPIGPVLYRLAEYVARRWNRPRTDALPPDRFGDFAHRAFKGRFARGHLQLATNGTPTALVRRLGALDEQLSALRIVHEHEDANFKREGETSGHADTLGGQGLRHNPGVRPRRPKWRRCA